MIYFFVSKLVMVKIFESVKKHSSIIFLKISREPSQNVMIFTWNLYLNISLHFLIDLHNFKSLKCSILY